MWKFIRKYLHYAVIGALLMVGEVFMDLLQPGIMRIIVDDGVLGSGSGDSNLRLIINFMIHLTINLFFKMLILRWLKFKPTFNLSKNNCRNLSAKCKF